MNRFIHYLHNHYSHAVARMADSILATSPKRPAWLFLPSRAYKKFVADLLIEKFDEVDDFISLKTKDGRVFIGPSQESEIQPTRKECERALEIFRKVGAKNEAALDYRCGAIIHEVVHRYSTEFCAYPYMGVRTKNLRPGDVFIDIGAFRGHVTLKAAELVGETGHVFAYEPMSVNTRYIQEHISANNHKNVEVTQSVVSTSESEEISFHVGQHQHNSEVSDFLTKDLRKVDHKNIAAAKICNDLISRDFKKIIFSITTNGTEPELAREFLSRLIGHVDFLQITIPIIYTYEEATETIELITKLSPKISVTRLYPWACIYYSK